jgi:hypothetical protein
MKRKPFRLSMGRSTQATRLPSKAARKVGSVRPVRASTTATQALRALKATRGAAELLAEMPSLGNANAWTQIAFFSVCQKTGTATYLDIWDADHFDYFTDMQRELTDCRVWFSDQGFAAWNSPQTHTGRINCYFRAPSTGNYVCNVQLQSFAGPAMVECLIDTYDFGPLPFNGAIVQPHPSYLSAGYHSFKINQLSGAYFFIGMTVWEV